MKLLPLMFFCSALSAGNFPPIQSLEEIVSELKFLTDFEDQVGFAYQGTAGSLKGMTLPLSYYSTADYWAKYVGALPGNDLHVVNAYNGSDYTLTPTGNSPGKDLQVERVNVSNGTDIYDAACWQMALAVCGRSGLKGPLGEDLFTLAQNQDHLLQVGYDGNATSAEIGANRAITHADGTFEYGGEKITDHKKAYFYRMVTRNWLSTDPFLGTPYMEYIRAENLPPNPDYKPGKITWLDWKPITGENAWAFLIGPLQAAHLEQQASGRSYVPFSSAAVQNALGSLHAFSSMQSEIGALYYACKGSLGNQGGDAVNPYEVSVENNASVLAGLWIFQSLLQDELAYETSLTEGEKGKIEAALTQIDTLLQGLLDFFEKYAWNPSAGIFYQGGDANNPALTEAWVPTSEPKAVDVSTWGVSVLGQSRVDGWYGFGTCYDIWQNVKSWGGFYGPDGALWGVGYSNVDGNGGSGNYAEGILSAEWTAGAINLLRCLITAYGEVATSEKYTQDQRKEAAEFVTDLQKDHDSMHQNLMTLRTDLYASTDAYSGVRPAEYDALIPIPEGKRAFLYASKRYMIPFGWVANPLPSTTSTAWAIFLHYQFNPFKWGGSY